MTQPTRDCIRCEIPTVAKLINDETFYVCPKCKRNYRLTEYLGAKVLEQIFKKVTVTRPLFGRDPESYHNNYFGKDSY